MLLRGTIIIYYRTLSRGIGFKIWMLLEMESVPKLLHSHLPNQVIEPFPKDYHHFSSPIISLQFLLPNQIPKYTPNYIHLTILIPCNPSILLIHPLIPSTIHIYHSLTLVNRFVDKSIQLRLKPLIEPLRAIYNTPLILPKNTTNIM